MCDAIGFTGALLLGVGMTLIVVGGVGLLAQWRAGGMKVEVVPWEEVERIFDLEDDDEDV